MPALPSCILDRLRETFIASLPTHLDDHPLGCHNPRIDDAVVFDHLIAALVTGCGYDKVADHACSATTMRRRRDHWQHTGAFAHLKDAAIAAYERMVGLNIDDIAIDGCIVKAPAGGEVAGRSPVDRGKQGTKRSQAVDAAGIALVTIAAPANVREHTLLPATLDALDAFTDPGAGASRSRVHLDAGYDYRPCRQVLAEHHLIAEIARRATQTPIQHGRRWVVEPTNSWMNNFGKLRRCTERRAVVVAAHLDLATAIITVRALIRACWLTHRWPNRPTTRRIR